MIPGKTHQAISDANERIAEECFKQGGLKPIRLDVRGRRQTTKRPEFVVNDASDRPVVVCEVKTILSPRFETAATKYSFPSRLLAVGVGEIRSDGPVQLIEEIL